MDLLRMCYASWIYCKPIWPVQAILQSKIANISIVIVQGEATFTDTLQILLSYERFFEEDYGVRVVDVRVMDIAEDMMSSEFFAARAKATYICYSTGKRMIIKLRGFSRVLLKLRMNAVMAETLDITYFHDPTIYIPSEQAILLIIQAAVAIARNDQKPAYFQTNYFYAYGRALVDELHLHRLEQNKEKFLAFALFQRKDLANKNNIPLVYSSTHQY